MDNALRHQGRCHPLDPWQPRNLVVLQALVCREVGGDDPQQVVGLAEETFGLHDVGNARNPRLEAKQGCPIGLAHGDENQRLESEPDPLGVHYGPVPADRSAAFQFPQPAVTRGDAEAHLCGKFGDGEPPVLLQCSKDLSIYHIHEADSSTKERSRDQTWEHLPDCRR